MKNIFSLFFFVCLAIVLPTAQNSPKVLLPNGWSLSPVGRSISLGDLPLNMVVSSHNKYIAVTNNGQSIQTIQLIDPMTERTLDIVQIPKSFYGLSFSKDEKSLYASGGNDNLIMKYSIDQNKLKLIDSLKLGNPWPEKISPVGIALDEKRNRIYAVTKENNSLYTIDLALKKVIKKIELHHEAFACLLSKDMNTLMISLWGGKKIALYDLNQEKVITEIPVLTNPNEIIRNKKGDLLYVANAGDNAVSVIDLKTKKVIEVLNAALYPDSPEGSSTNGLALTDDEKTLFIANADNNCLAVYDVSKKGKSKSKGFIPVGWYPTSIKVIGNKIFVANGKGFSSFPNPLGPQPVQRSVQSASHLGEQNSRLQYIGSLMKGTMSIIDIPNEVTLKMYTKSVYENTPYKKENELITQGETGNPIPMKVGNASPIKYVFYVLKENRTYDQVLGDMKEGNGDESLCLFPQNITPNQHKIAREYVLLDNFYVDAEVSADGHNWSMGAHANDYLEKTWPTGYGRRGGVTEGMGRRGVANNRDGFIWDFCKRVNVSYRTYGVFADNDKGNIPSLDKNHTCSYFTGYYNQKVKDTTRFYQWRRDFDSLVKLNAVPSLSTIRLGADHTQGLGVGRPTPFACVADNDLAVGMLVEHISKSSIWSQSAIFILEDDAQNGPDHVDAHRSIAFVISPYTKRNFVDHTMYTTSGMLRTIELILGLPPMTQYDAAATPMFRSFSAKPDFTPFISETVSVDLDETNKVASKWSKISDGFDFSDVDKNNDLQFNEVLWKGIKGESIEMPAPRRSAFIKTLELKK